MNLKKAGLEWEPKPLDFFAIPDRGLDQRIFVINDVMSNLAEINGESAIAFQGAPEWALDYLLTSEIVWLPRESQIREALADLLAAAPRTEAHTRGTQTQIALHQATDSATCRIIILGASRQFTYPTAAEAYGRAYLYTLTALQEPRDGELKGA